MQFTSIIVAAFLAVAVTASPEPQFAQATVTVTKTKTIENKVYETKVQTVTKVAKVKTTVYETQTKYKKTKNCPPQSTVTVSVSQSSVPATASVMPTSYLGGKKARAVENGDLYAREFA